MASASALQARSAGAARSATSQAANSRRERPGCARKDHRQHPASAGVAQRQRRQVAARAGSDDSPPAILEDWRSFRARLVAQSGDGGWAARQAESNLQLLQMQNPVLAREDAWAHATGAPEVGGLLLATPEAPGLIGEEYWQAVVFLVQHGPQGSLGLILNRPTALKMKRGRGGLPLPIDGMEALRDSFADSRIYCGGYTGQRIVTVMHGHRRLQGALEVVPGICIGGGEAAVAEVATGGLQQIDFRFFCGVVAWQPGDLEKDVAAGAWHTAACSRVLVLKQCLQLPTPLWREVMCLMGGRYAEQAREQQRLDDGSESDD
ncbi:hypothetical protein ABPG75_003338 [Micractinium tetrahymenae]